MIPIPSSINPHEVNLVNGELVFIIDNPTNEQIEDLKQYNERKAQLQKYTDKLIKEYVVKFNKPIPIFSYTGDQLTPLIEEALKTGKPIPFKSVEDELDF